MLTPTIIHEIETRLKKNEAVKIEYIKNVKQIKISTVTQRNTKKFVAK